MKEFFMKTPKYLILWSVTAFILGLAFNSGGIVAVQDSHAKSIEVLEYKCEDLERVVKQIPVIEEKVSHIKERQERMSVVQDRIHAEQSLMIRALARIEGAINGK